MKNNLLILVAFVTLQMFAQKKEDIAPEVSKMIEATHKMDFDGIMDCTYPVLFDMAPREMIIDLMKDTFNNDLMSISFIETETETTISDVVQIKEGHYALVIFPSIMNMSFKNQMSTEQIDGMLAGLKSNMKTENISYNKESNSIIAGISSKTIAVFDKFTEGKWKFINYQEGQKEQLLMMLNQEVFDALGL